MVGWMSGISHNFLSFVHTPSVVDRLNGWQCKPDYFGCAPHKCFQLGFILRYFIKHNGHIAQTVFSKVIHIMYLKTKRLLDKNVSMIAISNKQ